MGEALFDLEQTLRSKRVTPQETSVLLTCKSEAIKDFVIGASAGAALAGLATRRVKTFLRMNLIAGGAFIAGMWRFGSSLDSAVDRILSMDGSRMQSELANIIVHKYRDNPWGMKHITKHFYVEEVFDDTRPDHTKLRWRPRNAFIENVNGNDYVNENHSDGPRSNLGANQIDKEYSLHRQVSTVKSTDDNKHSELHGNLRQVSAAMVDPGLKSLSDPFDFIYDYSSEEEQPYKPPSSKPATNSRRHKRAHRRRRYHREHGDE